MAGSLNHIIADDGSFDMELIENMGDAHEALGECHQFIAALLSMLNEPQAALFELSEAMAYPAPKAVPHLDDELWGHVGNRRGDLDDVRRTFGAGG